MTREVESMRIDLMRIDFMGVDFVRIDPVAPNWLKKSILDDHPCQGSFCALQLPMLKTHVYSIS